MTQAFKADEWTVVLPKERGRLFHSPYLEPASIVARETGSDLVECFACGQMREHVVPVEAGRAFTDLCHDCLKAHGL